MLTALHGKINTLLLGIIVEGTKDLSGHVGGRIRTDLCAHDLARGAADHKNRLSVYIPVIKVQLQY